MFIRFDYKCPDCGFQEERFVRKDMMDSQYCNEIVHTSEAEFATSACLADMLRLPAAPRTTFRFADRKLK